MKGTYSLERKKRGKPIFETERRRGLE